jgi:hypothetical protein
MKIFEKANKKTLGKPPPIAWRGIMISSRR